MNSRMLTLAGVSMISFGIGLATGTFFTKRYLTAQYEMQIAEEVRKAKEYYAKFTKQEEFSDPSVIVAQMTEIIEVQEYAEVPVEEPLLEPEAEPDEDDHSFFDYRREIPKRSRKIAYVISLDEFKENPKDFDQRTITYYAKDDVLADERDTPIDDVPGVVGEVALEQFGNGSQDPNIVYVRNERLSMDLEVIRDPDSFEETVLGNIRHSERIRKFRLDDD